MNFISKIIDRRRVWKTLPEYPVYSPPFQAVLSKEKIKANYDYFLEQKVRRAECLAKYMRLFSVESSPSRDALPALDGWLFRYGGHLIPSIGGEVMAAIHDYEPAWIGEFHGLNIIHDIAIFAGDYIVANNNNVRWEVFYGSRGGRDYEKIGFGQACLIGLCHAGCSYGDPYSIFHGVYQFCDAGRWRLREGDRVSKSELDFPGAFMRRLDYLASPNPTLGIPFSQLTIDD